MYITAETLCTLYNYICNDLKEKLTYELKSQLKSFNCQNCCIEVKITHRKHCFTLTKCKIVGSLA